MQQVSNGKILVVGLTCIDVVSYCSDGFPVEDSDTHCDEQSWNLGGNACNNTTVLRQLGADCLLVSAVADDPRTRFLIERLFVEVGLDPEEFHRSVLIRPNARQSISIVIINERLGTRTIVHKRGTCHEQTAEEFIDVIGDPSDYSWVHIEGRNFVETRRMLDYLLEVKQKCGKPFPTLSVELEKPRHMVQLETLVRGVDVLFVSKDFAAAKGYRNMNEAVEGLLFSLPEINPDATVICAWGDAGAAAGCKVNSSVDIVTCGAFPPLGSTVVDTLGAGDTFNAGTINALNRGVPLHEAITFGCRLAGAKCGQRGLKNIVLTDG